MDVLDYNRSYENANLLFRFFYFFQISPIQCPSDQIRRFSFLEIYNEVMTTRPVYTPKSTRPYYKREMVEFDWNPGVSPTQKLKNSTALREAYLKKHPNAKILEVSTKSDLPAGQALSPFNLKLNIPALKKAFPVENIYQASKVFTHGGPYYDLLGCTPLQAKRDERLENSGRLAHFSFLDQQFPSWPASLFYNWLYIQALLENNGARAAIPNYTAFCDIEFNPETGINNQARACAAYLGLYQAGLLDKAKDFEEFKSLFLESDITETEEQHAEAKIEKTLSERAVGPARRTIFSVGQWLDHPGIGKGEVYKKTKDAYVINFKVSGPRTISKEYVETHCKKTTPY